MARNEKTETHKHDNGTTDQPGDAMTPLFPSIPVDDLTHVSLYVKAKVEDEVRDVFLGDLPPTTTQNEIKHHFGGGIYVLAAMTGEDKTPSASRELTLSGEPLWLDHVRRAVQSPDEAAQAPKPEWDRSGFAGSPWGPGGMHGMPGQPGMPGYPPGMMPPGMWPGWGYPANFNVGPTVSKTSTGDVVVPPNVSGAEATALIREQMAANRREKEEATALGVVTSLMKDVLSPERSTADKQATAREIQVMSDALQQSRNTVIQLQNEMQNQRVQHNAAIATLQSQMDTIRLNADTQLSSMRSKHATELASATNDLATLREQILKLREENMNQRVRIGELERGGGKTSINWENMVDKASPIVGPIVAKMLGMPVPMMQIDPQTGQPIGGPMNSPQ